MGVLEVAGNETFEALLASCVPELQTIGFVLVGEVAHEEVDADGGLGPR